VIPAAFDYLRAQSTDEALAQLQQHGADARVLAGGQSLVPAMRFRLARPAVLVDINPIRELELRPHERRPDDRRHRARQRPWSARPGSASAVEPHPRRLARGRRPGRPADGAPWSAASATTIRLATGRRRRWRRAPRWWCAARRRAHRADRRVPGRQLHHRGRRGRDGAGRALSRRPTTARPGRTRRSNARSATTPRPPRPCSCRSTPTARSARRALRCRPPAPARCASPTPRRCSRGRSRRPTSIRAAAEAAGAEERAAGRPARQRRIQEESRRRARQRAACARPWRVWGCSHEGQHQDQRRPARSDVEPRTLLAYFLREDCGLTGTHVGCDTSSCGCCVVVMDGDRA
jgi:hypothetical protein